MMNKPLPTLFILTFFSSVVCAQGSLEQKTYQTAKNIKPITTEEWNKVLGERSNLEYDILPGDTLYDLSGKFFGDPNYWPKLWQVNQKQIRNAHVLLPGWKLVFTPGNLTVPPEVKIERPDEWKSLPDNQAWELVEMKKKIDAEIDPMGLDRRSKVHVSKPGGYEVLSFIRKNKIEPLGKIYSSLDPSKYLMLGSIVNVKLDGDYLEGSRFQIISSGEKFEAPEKRKYAYLYHTLGLLEVISNKDGVMLAKIIESSDLIPRDSLLVPVFPTVMLGHVKPRNQQVSAQMFRPQGFLSFLASQHSTAFLDRGTESGIEIGDRFKLTRNVDPQSSMRKVTPDPILSIGDAIVIEASEGFSTVRLLQSFDSIELPSEVSLVQNINEIAHKNQNFEKTWIQSLLSTPQKPAENIQSIPEGEPPFLEAPSSEEPRVEETSDFSESTPLEETKKNEELALPSYEDTPEEASPNTVEDNSDLEFDFEDDESLQELDL